MLPALAVALSFVSEEREAATLASEPAPPREQVARKLEFAAVPGRLSYSSQSWNLYDCAGEYGNTYWVECYSCPLWVAQYYNSEYWAEHGFGYLHGSDYAYNHGSLGDQSICNQCCSTNAKPDDLPSGSYFVVCRGCHVVDGPELRCNCPAGANWPHPAVFAVQAVVTSGLVLDDGSKFCTAVGVDHGKLFCEEHCVDKSTGCPGWARDGQCDKSPDWYHANCRYSCGQCDMPPEHENQHGFSVREALGQGG